MNKHLFLAAFAAVSSLVTSCSDDCALNENPSEGANTIAFSAGKNNQSSRSGVTVTSLDKFTVTSVNPDNTLFFDGEQFNYADGVFKSPTPHYWPTTGTLSFYAISDVGENTFTEANVPQYTYAGWTGEKDLVAATVIAGEKEIPYPLTFQHLTSQVIIGAEAENKTEELTYKLVSVEMTTPSTGTYSFADATGGTGTWSINNDQTTTYTFEEALPMSFAQNASNKLDNCYWNILPVTDGKIYFRVEYQVFQNGKIISDFTGENYKECTIDNPNLQSGKIYTYNFILTRGTNSEITFTTTITDWADNGSTDHMLKEKPIAIFTYLDGNGTQRKHEFLEETAYNWNMVEGKSDISTVNNTLKSVYFSDKVQSIAERTFYNCKELTDVRLPVGLTSLPGTVEWSDTNYGSVSYSMRRDYGMFANDIKLANIEIPSTVETIGAACFKGCNALTEMTIPESVTSIGGGAFYYCKGLRTVHLPSQITSIPQAMFTGCSALESVNIPENVTRIGGCAFQYCSAIESIHIPETVTSLGWQTFRECSNLTDVNIPSKVGFIGDYCFAWTKIKNVRIPKSCYNMGSYTFLQVPLETVSVEPGNPNLDSRDDCNCIIRTASNQILWGSKNSVVPDGIEDLDITSFAYAGPEHLILPSSVTKIRRAAISADDIKRVTVTGNAEMEEMAISGKNVTTVDLPAQFSVKGWAIKNCPNLKDIYFAGTKDQWKFKGQNLVFCNTPITFTVHCSDCTYIYENVTSSNDTKREI